MSVPYQRIVGRYALFGTLATGGMATVYLARFTSMGGFGRTVAVKSLHPQYARDADFLAMFIDEARLASRIQHPNVVSTLDIVAGEGELFLVMEYVAGESLSRLVKACHSKGQRVPLEIALSISVGILHGLHTAHEAEDELGKPLGIVHRDISPQNILVGQDGIARILDFGIAKARGRVQITRDGQIKGKLAYMSPEQLRQQRLDRRADIYAASIVLWEMLVGRRLFQGEDETATLKNVLMPQVAPPSSVAPDLPRVLDTIVLKGLAERREDRYATARDMASELETVFRLASPNEVGRWVERTSGAELLERATRVAAIERVMAAQPHTVREAITPDIERLGRSSAESEAQTEILTTGFSQNPAPAPSTDRRPKPSRYRLPPTSVGAALVLALIGGLVFWTNRSGPMVDDESRANAGRARAGETDAEPPAVEASPQATIPAPAASSKPELPAATTSSAVPPRASGARRIGKRSAKPVDDCAEPFTIDSSGVKIPKRHCLKK